MIRLLRSLCGSWGILPASYTLEGEVTITSRDALARRRISHCVIFCGTWRSEKVAVKIMVLPRKEKKKVWVMAPL